jgi:hypothetical protein
MLYKITQTGWQANKLKNITFLTNTQPDRLQKQNYALKKLNRTYFLNKKQSILALPFLSLLR